MFDPNSIRQVISKIPMFDWPELDGKTLTLRVDVMGECDSNIEHTTVTGVDADGRVYVLVSTQRVV